MGRHELRWWDGKGWTEHVSDHGVTAVDPLLRAAPPVPAATLTNTPQAPLPAALPAPLPAPLTAHVPAPVPAQAPPLVPLAIERPAPKRRTGMIAVVIAAVLALGGGGAYLVTRNGTGSSSTASTVTTTANTTTRTSVTTPTAAATATTTPATTTPATPPTVTPPGSPAERLAAVLPASAAAPASWTLDSPADLGPKAASGVGIGFCGAGNDVARAQAAGATAAVHGATWDLPDGEWVGVDAYSFATPAQAEAFLTTTDEQANGCMSDPPMYTMLELEAHWFSGADDALWSVVEAAGAYPDQSPDADTLLRTSLDKFFTSSYNNNEYAATASWLTRYERHGRVVLAFWVHGRWGFSGFAGSDPTWTHQPTENDTDALAARFRPAILQGLAAIGAL